MQHKHSYFAKALHTLHPSSSNSSLINYHNGSLYRVDFMRIDSPKSYENENLGISFKYPKNYEILMKSNLQTIQMDLIDRNGNGKEMLRITHDVLKHDISTRDYISQSLMFVSQNASQNHRILEEIQVDVNGAQATQIVVEWNLKGVSFTTCVKHPYKENTMVVVNQWIEDSNLFEIKKDIARNILHSMILSRTKNYSNYLYTNEMFGFSLVLPSSDFKIGSKLCGQSSQFNGRNVISHLVHSNSDELIDQEFIIICEKEKKKSTLPSRSIKVGTCEIEGETVKYISPDYFCHVTHQKISYCFFEVYFVHNSMYYTLAARCLPSATIKFETVFMKLIKEMKLFESREKQLSTFLYQHSDCSLQVLIPMKLETIIKECNTSHSCVDFETRIDSNRLISTSIYSLDSFVSTMDQLSKSMFTESASLPAFTLIRNERRKLKDGRTDSHYLVCTFYDKSQCKFLTTYQTSIITKKGKIIVVRISVAKGTFNSEIEQFLEIIQSSIQFSF